MNFAQLNYFIKIADMGSLSKAALELNIAQPSLSRQLRLLETDLHIALFQRTGRGVVLTNAGKRLYDHAMVILQLVAHARDDLTSNRDEPTGRIAIGLPPSMGRMLTSPLVDEFQHVFPKARLAVVEGLSAHLIEWIANGRVDLGLIHALGANAAIETIPVLDESLCFIAASGRRPQALHTKSTMSFAELATHPLILPDQTHAIRRILETHSAMAGVKLQIAYEVSSVQSILHLVRDGHGHAVLPHSAVLASESPKDFLMCSIGEAELKSTLCLAVSAHKPRTPLVRRVGEMLRRLLLERIAAQTASHIKKL